MELCYRNNQKSLFRKYSKLVTWLSNTGIGRDYLGLPKTNISLMLPNGYEEYGGKGDYRSTFFTRPKYVKKLWPALVAIDRTAQWLHDFEEAKRLLAWELGLTRRMPALAEAVLFTTFYPDPDTEVTSVDGTVRRSLVDQTYTNIRAGAGTTSADSVASGDAWYIQGSATTNQYQGNQRSLYLYDTSAIPATDTTDSGTHSVFIRTGARYSQVGSFNIALVASTPASNTALAAADYGQLGATRFATDITGVENQYNDQALNASGLANIGKGVGGMSKFGIMSSVDFDAGEPTWASGGALSADGISFAETGGSPPTVNDPKLTVEHTASSYQPRHGFVFHDNPGIV